MGGLGNQGGNIMQHDFKYISKRDPEVKAAYDDLMNLLNEIRADLAEYTFQHRIVGSYSRNMITYDEKSNKGFDFDINIYPNDEGEQYSAEEIRKYFRLALDKHVWNHHFDYSEDSTRVLTIKVKDRLHSRIIYSVDMAFVYEYEDNKGNRSQQYIRFNKKDNRYSWEQQPKDFYGLPDKENWIKKEGLWESVLKPLYIEKKNANSDMNKHSRSIYAEAVNEVCQRYGYV